MDRDDPPEWRVIPAEQAESKVFTKSTSMMGPRERIEYLTRELHRDHPGYLRAEIERAVRTAALELEDTGNREEVRRLALTLLRSAKIDAEPPAGSYSVG